MLEERSELSIFCFSSRRRELKLEVGKSTHLSLYHSILRALCNLLIFMNISVLIIAVALIDNFDLANDL